MSAICPTNKVVGISKLARVVEAYARRLQVQEKMNAQIAHCIQKVLEPKGVAVVIEAAHQCMTTRGVHKTGVTMVTSTMLGEFRKNDADAARIPEHDRQSRHPATTAEVMSAALDLIKTLIAFDTTSRGSNLALIDFAQELLEKAGARCRRTYDATGSKANLFATLRAGRRRRLCAVRPYRCGAGGRPGLVERSVHSRRCATASSTAAAPAT